MEMETEIDNKKKKDKKPTRFRSLCVRIIGADSDGDLCLLLNNLKAKLAIHIPCFCITQIAVNPLSLLPFSPDIDCRAAGDDRHLTLSPQMLSNIQLDDGINVSVEANQKTVALKNTFGNKTILYIWDIANHTFQLQKKNCTHSNLQKDIDKEQDNSSYSPLLYKKIKMNSASPVYNFKTNQTEFEERISERYLKTLDCPSNQPSASTVQSFIEKNLILEEQLQQKDELLKQKDQELQNQMKQQEQNQDIAQRLNQMLALMIEMKDNKISLKDFQREQELYKERLEILQKNLDDQRAMTQNFQTHMQHLNQELVSLRNENKLILENQKNLGGNMNHQQIKKNSNLDFEHKQTKNSNTNTKNNIIIQKNIYTSGTEFKLPLEIQNILNPEINQQNMHPIPNKFDFQKEVTVENENILNLKPQNTPKRNPPINNNDDDCSFDDFKIHKKEKIVEIGWFKDQHMNFIIQKWKKQQNNNDNIVKLYETFCFGFLEKSSPAFTEDDVLCKSGIKKSTDPELYALIPVNYPNSHWALLVWKRAEAQFYYLDSMNWTLKEKFLQPEKVTNQDPYPPDRRKACQRLLNLSIQENSSKNIKKHKKILQIYDAFVPQQINDKDCGPLVLVMMQKLMANNADLIRQLNPKNCSTLLKDLYQQPGEALQIRKLVAL